VDKNHIKGVIGMAIAAVLFAIMGALLRYAGDTGVYSASLFRFLTGLAISAALVLTGRDRFTFRRKGLLVTRGVLGGVGVVIYYLCIQKIGLAKGTALSFSYPVFAAVFGAWFLGEQVNRRQWVMIATAFCGILLASGCDFKTLSMGLYESLAIAQGAMAGAIVVMIRTLRRTESVTSIFISQCIGGFIIVALPARIEITTLTEPLVWILLVSAVVAAAAQLVMTYSYTHVPAATGSVMGMLTPVIGVVLGIVIFDEVLDARTLAGVIMILVGCVGTALTPRVPKLDAAIEGVASGE